MVLSMAAILCGVRIGAAPERGNIRWGSSPMVTGVTSAPLTGSISRLRLVTEPTWKPRSITGAPTSSSPTGSLKMTR